MLKEEGDAGERLHPRGHVCSHVLANVLDIGRPVRRLGRRGYDAEGGERRGVAPT